MSGNGPVRGRAIDRLRGLAWPMLPMAAAMAAMGGAFSNRAVFYVRDLAQFYYPLHIWYRETVRSGASVLWDPYVGFGQSAIADPARNLMFPPVVLLRLLAPETLGFNLSVALPFPLAALGAFALFRRRVSAQAAALGASVFALSGPVLSTGSFLNMSWTLAVAPWVLLAADRFVETGSGRRFAELAALIALQLLAGEPVTFASTCAVAIGLSVVCARERGERALRAARLLAATFAAYASGACVAAVQLLPLVDATRRSARATTRPRWHSCSPA